jgi:hypothetical protein
VDHYLKAIIALYEEEKTRLQERIEICLANEEYKIAHDHARALRRHNRRLQILHRLNDPQYERKQYLERKIRLLEQQVKETDNELLKTVFTNQIAAIRKDLSHLNKTITEPKNEITTSQLQTVLARLMNHQIKYVKLVLHQQNQFFLSFTYSGNQLKISLPYIRQLLKNEMLNHEKIEQLKHSGFYLNDSSSKLVLTIEGNPHRILDQVHLIISRVLFDIIHTEGLRGQSFLQWLEKVD